MIRGGRERRESKGKEGKEGRGGKGGMGWGEPRKQILATANTILILKGIQQVLKFKNRFFANDFPYIRHFSSELLQLRASYLFLLRKLNISQTDGKVTRSVS
jgi:hypothetical protein